MRSTVQMAASFSQIKNITAQSFCLSGLTINRMLASTVFKKTQGTGSAYNKSLKTTPFGRSDAFTRGGFAIMPHATAPLSLMLGTSRKESEFSGFKSLKKSKLVYDCAFACLRVASSRFYGFECHSNIVLSTFRNSSTLFW
jgi:hypothetical protein